MGQDPDTPSARAALLYSQVNLRELIASNADKASLSAMVRTSRADFHTFAPYLWRGITIREVDDREDIKPRALRGAALLACRKDTAILLRDGRFWRNARTATINYCRPFVETIRLSIAADSTFLQSQFPTVLDAFPNARRIYGLDFEYTWLDKKRPPRLTFSHFDDEKFTRRDSGDIWPYGFNRIWPERDWIVESTRKSENRLPGARPGQVRLFQRKDAWLDDLNKATVRGCGSWLSENGVVAVVDPRKHISHLANIVDHVNYACLHTEPLTDIFTVELCHPDEPGSSQIYQRKPSRSPRTRAHNAVLHPLSSPSVMKNLLHTCLPRLTTDIRMLRLDIGPLVLCEASCDLIAHLIAMLQPRVHDGAVITIDFWWELHQCGETYPPGLRQPQCTAGDHCAALPLGRRIILRNGLAPEDIPASLMDLNPREMPRPLSPDAAPCARQITVLQDADARVRVILGHEACRGAPA